MFLVVAHPTTAWAHEHAGGQAAEAKRVLEPRTHLQGEKMVMAAVLWACSPLVIVLIEAYMHSCDTLTHAAAKLSSCGLALSLALPRRLLMFVALY